MSSERHRMASNAVSADPEDVSDDEREALEEFIALDGNVWGL